MSQKTRSKSEIYLHLIWATKGRQPLVTPALERELYRCIVSEAEKLHCIVLAIGGLEDHVHLAVQIPARVCASDLMKRLKGISSAFANDLLKHESLFRWQEGYGVFSVSRSHLQRVVGYVRSQKNRHQSGKLWLEWEETEEEVDED